MVSRLEGLNPDLTRAREIIQAAAPGQEVLSWEELMPIIKNALKGQDVALNWPARYMRRWACRNNRGTNSGPSTGFANIVLQSGNLLLLAANLSIQDHHIAQKLGDMPFELRIFGL